MDFCRGSLRTFSRPDDWTVETTVAWVVYDLANTIFALGVVGLYFPEWLTTSGLSDSSLAVTAAAAGSLVRNQPAWRNCPAMFSLSTWLRAHPRLSI